MIGQVAPDALLTDTIADPFADAAKEGPLQATIADGWRALGDAAL